MALSNIPDAIEELRTGRAQLKVLKFLKNEAIGHIEKKQALIYHGVVDALRPCLANVPKSSGKKKRSVNGTGDLPSGSTLTEEEEVRHHALILCGSLAHGGPTFAAPLIKGDLISSILTSTLPSENPPKLVSASLRALTSIARAHAASTVEPRSLLEHLSEQLYSQHGIRAYTEILSQLSPASGVQRQVILTCELLSSSLHIEQHRNALVSAGILDLLGARLASYYVCQQFWSTKAVKAVRAALPPPPPRHQLSYIFEAINAIISKSRYRVARLLYSPIVTAILPLGTADAASEALMHFYNVSPRNPSSHLNPVDVYLPRMPASGVRDPLAKTFPTLASLRSEAKHSALMDLAESMPQTPDKAGSPSASESAMISWLIFIIRHEHSLTRLGAARLLTTIARAGFLHRNRDRMLALLVVPALVEMIDGTPNGRISTKSDGLDVESDQIIQEQAPKVLAELIKESPMLQKAAVDSRADEKALAMLKRSFAAIDAKPLIWSASKEDFSSDDLPSSRKLSPASLRSDVQHAMKRREASLILISAICEKERSYRTSLTDKGVVPPIIDSLTAMNERSLKLLSGPGRVERLSSTYGNTVPVLIAACLAARSLSRSVDLLRTALIDNGLVAPTYALLKDDICDSVLIAATDVICNLVLEFSPMREDLIKFGVIQTLCDHAHSTDSRIRLVSLWALKHLVNRAPPDICDQCFEGLGTSWLLKILTGAATTSNPRSAKSSPISMGAANAAGERIDILNAIEDEAMDISTDARPQSQQEHQPQRSNDETLIPPTFSHLHELIPIATQHQSRLRNIRSFEDAAPQQQAVRDEIQVQVQALDFVRNLVQGPGVTEMVDKVFNQLGSARIFEIIIAKLATNSERSSITTTNSESLSWLQPPEILSSTLYLLVNFAAGLPRQRQLIVSQRNLLLSVLQCFSHPETHVKLPALLMVQNLCWPDDNTDRDRVRETGATLRDLGFANAIEKLKDDPVLDVRQKADLAWRNLIDGENGTRGPASSASAGNGSSSSAANARDIDMRSVISGGYPPHTSRR